MMILASRSSSRGRRCRHRHHARLALPRPAEAHVAHGQAQDAATPDWWRVFCAGGDGPLSLATFSTPFSSHIYFIRALESFGQIRFGGFGWCNLATAECEGPVLGYGFGGGQVTVWLTGAEVTIGIAAIFSLFATIAIALDTLFRSSYALQNPLWFRAFAVLASLFSILAFVFSAVLWYDTRVKFVRSGIEAKYGPALWILLGGTIAAALSLCAGGPRFTGRHLYRANIEASYTV